MIIKERLQDVINETLRLGYEIKINQKQLVVTNDEEFKRANAYIKDGDIMSALVECMSIFGHVKYIYNDDIQGQKDE